MPSYSGRQRHDRSEDQQDTAYYEEDKPSRVKAYLPWILGLGLVAIVIGVYAATRPTTGGEQAACALVIDRTGSSAGAATTEAYKQAGHDFVKTCAAKSARFTVYSFTASERLKRVGTWDLYNPATKDSPTKSEKQKLADRMNSRTGAAQQAIDSLVKPKVAEADASQGSDIVTAYDNVTDNMAGIKTSEKYLVFLTDGIQSAPSLSFAPMMKGKKSPADILKAARNADLIPNTKGLSVWFIGVHGASADTQAGLTVENQADIERFWRTMTTDNGGQFCGYSSDSAARFIDACAES